MIEDQSFCLVVLLPDPEVCLLWASRIRKKMGGEGRSAEEKEQRQ